ncbi:MAG: MraZ protein [Parcubacteria group bacterium Gr01-1014_107]|nr:MAG: MraZ protein [Parcubacteria group bacterium Gr01-1014_107]
MLIGEYTHTLDGKKRTSLPSKFRKEIGRKVVITPGLDSCLFMYPLSGWQKIAEKLAELGTAKADRRSFNRFMLAGAVEVEVDTIGRILIPDHLRAFADLEDKIVFAGVYNRVEIWNSDKWSKYKKKVENQADVLAEKLGEVGGF